ncbi:MAG: PDZ domain-containing protein [Pseudomonadota bacterium]
MGLTVQTATADLAGQFDVKPGEGVIVTEVEPGSIAAMAGISRGAVILEINRKPVNSSTEFKQAIKKISADKQILLLIRANDGARYVVLSWR